MVEVDPTVVARTRSASARAVAVLGCAIALSALSGCVERFLRIDTQPTAADVFINGQSVGKSPVEVEFQHYGVMRVDVWYHDFEQESFASHTEMVDLETPWYQITPMDLFSELFDPRTHVDLHEFKIDLDLQQRAGAEDGAKALLETAQELRQAAR